MDIVEFVNALNAKISTLESTNAELSSKLKEYEEKESQNRGASEAEAAELREKLEEEIKEHHFTKLQLEDERNNGELSLKMLRELQTTTSVDSGGLQATLRECESAIARLQQELSMERERRSESEAAALQEKQNTYNQTATRQALKAMVSVLNTQLKQSQRNLEASNSIISRQKEEIDRKLSIFLNTDMADSGSGEASNLDGDDPKATKAREVYLEELDSRFKSIVDMVEEVEGKPLNLDAASAIKSALREAKQVIGEEIIISHANRDLEAKLRASTLTELQDERRTTNSLLSIISELQLQLDLLTHDGSSPNEFDISFISAGLVPGD